MICRNGPDLLSLLWLNPDENISIIVAKNRKQAMDWSLVLASQGIEPIIHRSEGGIWELHLPPSDSTRAFEALRAYQKENRSFRWVRPITTTRVVFHWGALVWVLWQILFNQAANYFEWTQAGQVDAGALAARHEWWRWFTAVWLHADVAHLMANLVMGFLFLGLAMPHYGSGVALLLSFFAGALGNIASTTLHGAPYFSVGASGLVMGSLGLLSVYWIRVPTEARPLTYLRRGLLTGALFLTLFGLNPKTDVAAHVGGFAGGVLLGLLGHRLSSPRANAAAWVALGIIWATTWFLALK